MGHFGAESLSTPSAVSHAPLSQSSATVWSKSQDSGAPTHESTAGLEEIAGARGRGGSRRHIKMRRATSGSVIAASTPESPDNEGLYKKMKRLGIG